jgi:hypothetical protein
MKQFEPQKTNMPKLINIILASGNRTVKINSSINDSSQASIFADRINTLPYLKVFLRKYKYPDAEIHACIIPGDFTLEKLIEDVEKLFEI